MSGSRIQSVINKAQAKTSPGVITHGPAAQNDEAQGGATRSNLPRHFGNPAGQWDNQVEMKRQLIEKSGTAQTGAGTPYGQVMLSDRDIRAMLDKKKAGEAAAFDGWFGQNFNTNDLPTRLLGEQLNPEYYEKREEALVNKAELALRIELMKLYGPRSEEDLMIIWGLQSGYLKLDANWDKISYDETIDGNGYDQAANRSRFQREVNSVSRFFRPSSARDPGVRTTRAGEMAYDNTMPFYKNYQPTVADQTVLGDTAPPNLNSFFDFLRGQDQPEQI